MTGSTGLFDFFVCGEYDLSHAGTHEETLDDRMV
jgi:hypothetical protein